MGGEFGVDAYYLESSRFQLCSRPGLVGALLRPSASRRDACALAEFGLLRQVRPLGKHRGSRRCPSRGCREFHRRPNSGGEPPPYFSRAPSDTR
jgi:hypothetical protein